MRKTSSHHLDECVAVTATASRVADLDEAAIRLARSAFEAYKDPERGWVTAQGRKLHAVRRAYAEPHMGGNFGTEVISWQADYLVGTDHRDVWDDKERP